MSWRRLADGLELSAVRPSVGLWQRHICADGIGAHRCPGGDAGASPSPSLDYTGSLHVLQGHSVSTYAIDATTGKLRLASTAKVGEANA